MSKNWTPKIGDEVWYDGKGIYGGLKPLRSTVVCADRLGLFAVEGESLPLRREEIFPTKQALEEAKRL